MRYARLFADDTGESHFDEIEIEFTATDYVQSAASLDFSATLTATQIAFMRAPAGWASDFHVSSGRNLFVVLSGEWDVTASDGASRHFAVGSALLVEDMTGSGHSSRVVSDTESVAVVVQLTHEQNG